MSHHSPDAPWKAVYFANSDQWDVSNDAGDPSEEYSVLEDLSESHARLIAAAPDLLYAAKQVLSEYDINAECDTHEMSLLRAAVAKAQESPDPS